MHFYRLDTNTIIFLKSPKKNTNNSYVESSDDSGRITGLEFYRSPKIPGSKRFNRLESTSYTKNILKNQENIIIIKNKLN